MEVYSHIFYMIEEGDIPSIKCKMSQRRPKSMRELDGLTFIFIEFYVSELTPRFNGTEITLQLSENITLSRYVASAKRSKQTPVF
jgi:hypothetical protein